MKTKGIKHEVVEVDVSPLNFLIDLFKSEFMGYDLYNDFRIEDTKLYVLIDVSYHGSPIIEERLLFDDEIKIKKFNHIKELIKLYS
jgi:hypothetical protein